MIAARPISAQWWLHPVACVALVALVYASFPLFDFASVVPKAYIPGPHYAFGFALLAALAVGMAATLVDAEPEPVLPGVFDLPRGVSALLLLATLFAYAVWFAPLAVQPGLVVEILSGERTSLRDVAATTPGLTTMTQFGVAYAIAQAALVGGRARPVARWERLGLVAVFALGALRTVVWSERLALIELVVTWSVARLAFAHARSDASWKRLAVLPLAVPPLLYLGFTGTEYFRSWEYYRHEVSSIWAFSFDRLLAYYATASNNGIGLLVENTQWPQYSGRYVAEWLYMMPVLGEALRDSVGDASTQYNDFLLNHARIEFNNPSGLFPIVFDIGYTGALLYFLAVGAAIGRLWLLWRQRSPAGVLGYPVAVLFLVELLRFDYLAASRFFPIALALLLLWGTARPLRPVWRAAW